MGYISLRKEVERLFGETITFSEGLFITLLGMTVTFTALIVLSFILDLMRIVFYKKPKAAVVKKVEAKPEQTSITEAKQDDEELIAVITAAIAANLNTSTNNIIVKNITRLPDSTPAWGRAGRMDQMNMMM